MKIKLAKSMIENEEGTNHVLIEIPDSLSYVSAEIAISLPSGVSRSKNENGFYEDEFGTIFIDNISGKLQLLIEFFTEEPVSCGKEMIAVNVIYKDKEGKETCINEFLPLLIAQEDEMDELVVDKEVTDLVKRFLTGEITAEEDEDSEFVNIRPKTQQINNQFSELEKKYRIDF
ncbi:hypothetical protein COK06_09445 [Bacillus cereus]|nr:hypothetical protein CON40_09360 [Bacillus cereus]PEU01351.1 hypothetical protein CN527_12145 [Bacillus cereus]PFI97697.1 hypothetical protein COI88_26835 [Bacillus cereus]PFP98851.1 hypothetical protein COK06_09445 [Bacillus cereus]PGO00656.1 hypothetical protein CN976_14980 [Bacillus cereus]